MLVVLQDDVWIFIDSPYPPLIPILSQVLNQVLLPAAHLLLKEIVNMGIPILRSTLITLQDLLLAHTTDSLDRILWITLLMLVTSNHVSPLIRNHLILLFGFLVTLQYEYPPIRAFHLNIQSNNINGEL